MLPQLPSGTVYTQHPRLRNLHPLDYDLRDYLVIVGLTHAKIFVVACKSNAGRAFRTKPNASWLKFTVFTFSNASKNRARNFTQAPCHPKWGWRALCNSRFLVHGVCDGSTQFWWNPILLLFSTFLSCTKSCLLKLPPGFSGWILLYVNRTYEV